MALLVNVWFYMFCNILLNILLFTDFESKRARRRFRSGEKYINILFLSLLAVIGNPLIRGFGQLNSENYNTFFIPTFTPLHARSFIDRFKPIDFNYNSE